jgi:hypothetical protein
MEQIADLVKKSSDGAQNSAQACNDLSGLSSDLIDLISRFKLGNHPSGTGRRGAQTNDFAHRGDNQIPDYYAPTSIM